MIRQFGASRAAVPAAFLIPALPAFLLAAVLLAAAPRRALAFDEDAGHNGKIFATIMYNVPLEYAGTITEVPIRPGDKVKEGQPLVRFKLRDESILAILQYLSLDRTIINTQISIADNEIRITDLNKEYESAKRLSAAQMGSADLLRTLKHNVGQLRDKSGLLAGLMKIDKSELNNRLAIVRRKIGVPVKDGVVPEFGELLSPLEGEILLVDPSLRAGSIVPALPAAVTIGRTNPMEVRTRVFEAEIPGLRVGGKASVQVVSLDGVHDGIISHIDRYPDDMNVDRPSYYNVRIEIPNDDGKLRPGFKTVVKFVSDNKTP
ncbi:MAG: efflux RND transporter periplasmic adaptor subunit [Desulfovibrio sp.]|jgi:multidrug efflux pump subunit AcrA (membrane-fusion protein)|nr:efflux RND transporter periplasmic adaptor subunit [Desulfovibrio sp.]